MKTWQAGIIGLLLLIPLLFYMGIGFWTLWGSGQLSWAWWLLPLCWGMAYLLAKWWQSDLLPLPEPKAPPRLHWTPQDQNAWEIIQKQQEVAQEIPPEQLTDPHFYLQTAMDLSDKIAQHYHPGAKDPLSSLRIPEILAAAQLALSDLEEWMNNYVPGSHLLTVQQWRMLSKAPGWFRTASNLAWAGALFFNPAFVARYLASKLTLQRVTDRMQENIVAAFYIFFIRQVGFYLIEMNSGRLRGGAERYRAAVRKGQQEPKARSSSSSGKGPEQSRSAREGEGSDNLQGQSPEQVDVTITLIGQVKAGKSSLVNALLGERKAETDILPQTKDVQRFRLHLTDSPDRLILLDTIGYSEDGVTPSELKETQIAFQQSDLVLMVIDARSPARGPDLQLLQEMQDWFSEQSHLKPTPVLGVLSHIDGLSPVMEWNPPYNWQKPTEPKERTIGEAVEFNHQELQSFVSGVVPVCSDVDRGRVYGVEEWLLPAMTALLTEARACSLLRSLHTEIESKRVRRVFQQFRNAGIALLKTQIFD